MMTKVSITEREELSELFISFDSKYSLFYRLANFLRALFR